MSVVTTGSMKLPVVVTFTVLASALNSTVTSAAAARVNATLPPKS